MTEADRPYEIAYGVLAALVWITWVGVIAWATFGPAKDGRARDTGEKLERSAEGSEEGFRRDPPGATS